MSKQEEIRTAIDIYVDNRCLFLHRSCNALGSGYCSSKEEAYRCLMERLTNIGLVLKVEGELPLTKTEEFLLDYNGIKQSDGEGIMSRSRTILPYYPPPSEKYPLTKLHLDGEHIGQRLTGELDSYDRLLKAGYKLVEPLIDEE